MRLPLFVTLISIGCASAPPVAAPPAKPATPATAPSFPKGPQQLVVGNDPRRLSLVPPPAASLAFDGDDRKLARDGLIFRKEGGRWLARENESFAEGVVWAHDGKVVDARGDVWTFDPHVRVGSVGKPVRFVRASGGVLMAITRDEQLARSRDGGKTWTTLGGLGRVQSITIESSGNGAVFALPQRLYRTSDHGFTLEPLATRGRAVVSFDVDAAHRFVLRDAEGTFVYEKDKWVAQNDPAPLGYDDGPKPMDEPKLSVTVERALDASVVGDRFVLLQYGGKTGYEIADGKLGETPAYHPFDIGKCDNMMSAALPDGALIACSSGATMELRRGSAAKGFTVIWKHAGKFEDDRWLRTGTNGRGAIPRICEDDVCSGPWVIEGNTARLVAVTTPMVGYSVEGEGLLVVTTGAKNALVRITDKGQQTLAEMPASNDEHFITETTEGIWIRVADRIHKLKGNVVEQVSTLPNKSITVGRLVLDLEGEDVVRESVDGGVTFRRVAGLRGLPRSCGAGGCVWGHDEVRLGWGTSFSTNELTEVAKPKVKMQCVVGADEFVVANSTTGDADRIDAAGALLAVPDIGKDGSIGLRRFRDGVWSKTPLLPAISLEGDVGSRTRIAGRAGSMLATRLSFVRKSKSGKIGDVTLDLKGFEANGAAVSAKEKLGAYKIQRDLEPSTVGSATFDGHALGGRIFFPQRYESELFTPPVPDTLDGTLTMLELAGGKRKTLGPPNFKMGAATLTFTPTRYFVLHAAEWVASLAWSDAGTKKWSDVGWTMGGSTELLDDPPSLLVTDGPRAYVLPLDGATTPPDVETIGLALPLCKDGTGQRITLPSFIDAAVQLKNGAETTTVDRLGVVLRGTAGHRCVRAYFGTDGKRTIFVDAINPSRAATMTLKDDNLTFSAASCTP